MKSVKHILLLFVSLLAIGCGGSGGSASENDDFLVMVVRTTDSNSFELKARSSDGSEGTVLGPIGFNLQAMVSANGAKVASIASGQGNPLTVSNLDGSNPILIGSEGEEALHPALSPDGSKVVFQTTVSDEVLIENYLAISNTDGTGFQLLASPSDSPIHPQLNHEGTKIIFVSQDAGISVQIMDLDGTNQELLYQPDIALAFPALSPSGQMLAFVSNNELWVADLAGGTKLKIAEDVNVNRRPFFSPDGNWLVYTAMQTPGGGPITHPTKVKIDGTVLLPMAVTNAELIAGAIPSP